MQRSLPFETFRIGARMIVHLGEGASEVKTVFDNDVGLSIGESAIIVPDAEAVCAFDAASGRAIGAM
jgi:multiple sugar transport system ATP-binding protein